jgi:phosphate transport system substrate-binding protein
MRGWSFLSEGSRPFRGLAVSGALSYNHREPSIRREIELMSGKRSLVQSLLLTGLAACVVGCGLGYDDTGSNAQRPQVEPITVLASESAVPLMTLLASKANEVDEQLNVVFLPTGHSSGAVAATHMGESDIGVLSRPMTADEAAFRLEYLHLARDGLVFATHRDVQVSNLTSEQIRQIYSGELTNWDQVGGEDAEIVVLDRPEHTSPKLLLRQMLFNDGLGITERAVVLERPAMMNVSLQTLHNSIGYTSLGEVLISDLEVNVLALDGVSPTPQNVAESVYPLSRQIGLVIRRDPSQAVMRFTSFVYGKTGSEIMTGNGYSPTLLNLVVATIPERNAVRQEDRYRPLVEYLADRLGGKVRVSLRHLPAYELLVDEFVAGSANLAFVGSYAYALTKARVDVVPLARPEKNGVSTYRGLIFARKDSGIRTAEELRGKRFSMIKGTTAGELFPRVYLDQHGVIDPKQFFGAIVAANGHDASIRMVLDGRADAGAAKDLVFQQMAREDPGVEAQLTILASSRPVPDNALMMRLNFESSCFSCHQQSESGRVRGSARGLDRTRLTEKLRKELVGLEDSDEGRRVLEALGADRLVVTTHADYENLYAMIDELELDLSAE